MNIYYYKEPGVYKTYYYIVFTDQNDFDKKTIDPKQPFMIAIKVDSEHERQRLIHLIFDSDYSFKTKTI